MKINLRSAHSKILAAATTLMGLLLLAVTPSIVLAQSNTFPPSGNVGMGTTSPTTELDVTHNYNGNTVVNIKNNSTGSGSLAGFNMVNDTAGVYGIAARGSNNPYGILTGGPLYLYTNSTAGLVFMVDAGGPIKFATGGNAEMVRIDSSGYVGIGITAPTVKLHVAGAGIFTGDLTVGGNIASKYQDVAEWVESSQTLAAGTVVVLDNTKSNQVIASSEAYDTRVAGVISANPGITLGERGAAKLLVATTGRVRVKVDATAAPIQIGDLLVTSDKEGMAMKSLPVNIGGVQLHRPGTLIGKALEPLAKGQGEILVLLSLQ